MRRDATRVVVVVEQRTRGEQPWGAGAGWWWWWAGECGAGEVVGQARVGRAGRQAGRRAGGG